MKRSLLFAVPAVFFLLACGGGGGTGADAGKPGDECAKDQDCDDGVDCTRDLCVAAVNQVRSCWHEPGDDLCAPGETCQDASSPLPGCRPLAVIRCMGKADGADCDPSDPCAVGQGVCSGGQCVYPVKECPDLPCRKSPGCDPATGSCGYVDQDDGSDCFEEGDKCRPGQCDSGSCIAHDLSCDDGKSCTKDSCDPVVGCVNMPLTDAPCEDGDLCHGPDSCQDGECAAGPAIDCNDHNPCTADSCSPATGCLNEPVSPCCGNLVVETGEECDEGAVGTEGCSADCAFKSMTFAAPPEPGRFPAVAWSQTADQGLVAWEVMHENGNLALLVEPIDGHAATGPPVTIIESSTQGDFTARAPAIGAIDPAGVFLLAGFAPHSVDLWVLSKTGSAQVAGPGAMDLKDAAPTGVIRVGTGPATSAVAWQVQTPCAGSGSIPSAWVARVAAGPSGLLPSGPVLMAGDCESNTKGLLGGICAGNDVVMATVGKRTGSAVHHGGYGVVPITPAGVGEYHELAAFDGDLIQPPTCVTALDGQSFLIIYMLIVASPGGEGKSAIQLWSMFVDNDGRPIEDSPPNILQTTAMDPEQGYQACLPGFAALARLGGDKYLMACPMADMDAQGLVSSMVLSSFILNAEGLRVEGPVPFKGQSEQFALATAATKGPGSSALIAWLGRPDAVDFNPYAPPPYWIRAIFFGSF
ncbi:MAG: hypothetical protein GXP54_06705 [Deltaproteobacteria bacterium]|nr:hypothetical protein [Deltaproteobacteria bacterium]